MATRSARLFPMHRVEGYTDAVFAIAATLLVLDLTATAIGEVSTDDAMWAALADMSESFTAFFVSFGLLSLLWVIHLQQWRDIVKVDFGLLWLNNARLLFIVLIPFTTSIVSDYSRFYAGRMLLPLNFFFATLFGVLSWVWAAARGGHLLGDVTDDERRDQRLGGVSAIICATVAAAASPWLGSWAFLAYVFNAPLQTLLERRRRSRARG